MSWALPVRNHGSGYFSGGFSVVPLRCLIGRGEAVARRYEQNEVLHESGGFFASKQRGFLSFHCAV